MKKKVNKDPFYGVEPARAFEQYCCWDCVKYSRPREDGTFTNAGDEFSTYEESLEDAIKYTLENLI